jgi:hypothetical protein
MIATLATAALLLVPFLAVVLVGAVAVAIHDKVELAWSGRRAAVRAATAMASARCAGVPRGAGRRGASAILARSGSAPRRPARRATVVLVR